MGFFLGIIGIWVIFMAVVGFMSAALTALMGLGVMALPSLGSKDNAGTATVVGVIYVVIGALCVWPSVGLLRFGSAIGRLVRDPPSDVPDDGLGEVG